MAVVFFMQVWHMVTLVFCKQQDCRKPYVALHRNLHYLEYCLQLWTRSGLHMLFSTFSLRSPSEGCVGLLTTPHSCGSKLCWTKSLTQHGFMTLYSWAAAISVAILWQWKCLLLLQRVLLLATSSKLWGHFARRQVLLPPPVQLQVDYVEQLGIPASSSI